MHKQKETNVRSDGGEGSAVAEAIDARLLRTLLDVLGPIRPCPGPILTHAHAARVLRATHASATSPCDHHRASSEIEMSHLSSATRLTVPLRAHHWH
jgi:hypothetical protein